MAKARQCDRCGKYYSKNEIETKYEGRALCGMTTQYRADEKEREYEEKYYDLCDSCIGKLIDFLEMKEEKNEA